MCGVRRKGGRWPSFGAHLFTGLLAIAVLFPSFSGALAAQTLQAAGIFEDRIVICTGSGLKVLVLDANGEWNPETEDRKDIAFSLCVPAANATPADWRDDAFTRLKRPAIPDLPCPLAVLHEPRGTEHPPAPTRGPPVPV